MYSHMLKGPPRLGVPCASPEDKATTYFMVFDCFIFLTLTKKYHGSSLKSMISANIDRKKCRFVGEKSTIGKKMQGREAYESLILT